MDYNTQLHKCQTFLRNHDVGILATSTPSGEPHASLVDYLVDAKLNIYFMAREGAHKFRNIIRNAPTCLVVCSDNFTSSVEVKGFAYKSDDGEHTNDMLTKIGNAIRRKNPGPLPILHHPGSEIYLFRLEPFSLTYADFYTTSSHEGEFFEVTV